MSFIINIFRKNSPFSRVSTHEYFEFELTCTRYICGTVPSNPSNMFYQVISLAFVSPIKFNWRSRRKKGKFNKMYSEVSLVETTELKLSKGPELKFWKDSNKVDTPLLTTPETCQYIQPVFF